ncbi:MAG: hypothetical protein ACFFD2_06420 [Promethearchaeota archaeon]
MTKKNNRAYGLAAFGKSGEWTVAVDQTIQEPEEWFINLRKYPVNLYFRISSPKIIHQILEFIKETFKSPKYRDKEIAPGIFRHMDPKYIVIGSFLGIPVKLFKDGEFDDRYFIKIYVLKEDYIFITLIEQDIKDLKKIFQNIKEQL